MSWVTGRQDRLTYVAIRMLSKMIHGENLTLSLNGTIIAAAKSCSLKFEQSLLEVASPVSGADTMYVPTKHGWSISTDGLCATMAYMNSLLWNRTTKYTIAFCDSDLRMTFTGDCYIKSIAISGSIGKIVTYSIELQGSGVLSNNMQKLSLVKGGYDLVDNGAESIALKQVSRTSNVRQFLLSKGKYLIKIVGNIGPCYILNSSGVSEILSEGNCPYVLKFPNKEFSLSLGYSFYIMFADYGLGSRAIANPIL